ncbi:MAG: SDR family NAD(P)-dependent oxidoreductase [Gammaproteobacteria bacterium]|nr:SDR family NAD(P)-dependent oxidoreductase [Gammaproteobacteria bacterium]
MTLSGKHAVVTGGGSGIGAETARELAGAGAKVTILGRSKDSLQAQGIPYQICDVTDFAAVGEVYEKARTERGPISIVVANAGAAQSEPIERTDPTLLSNMFAVNVIGVFNVWKAALNDMRSESWGRMVVIASTAALKGYPYVSAYTASKHAVVGLMRSFSLELAKTGITVNAICPGYTSTPLLERTLQNIEDKTGMSQDRASSMLRKNNPQERFIEPRQVASAVKWLCSDASDAVNGHTLSVSGGEI